MKCIELPGRCGLNAFVGEKITEKTTINLETTAVTRFINDAEEKKFVNVEAIISEKVEQVRSSGNINKVRAQMDTYERFYPERKALLDDFKFPWWGGRHLFEVRTAQESRCFIARD